MSAVIRGHAGDDDLSGTTGDDTFNLSLGGNDTVDGGDGNDTFWMGATLTAADHIDGGAGIDTVTLNGDYSGVHAVVFAADTMVGVEKLYLNDGHSYDLTTSDVTVAAGVQLTIKAGALAGGNALTFNGAAETDGRFNVYAGAGDDVLTGGARNDTFHLGNGGNDTVRGGGGADLIDMGGSFNALDTIDGGNGNDGVFIDGMSGDDSILFAATTMTNVEYLGLEAGHRYDLITNDATVAAGKQMIVDGSLLGAGDVMIFDGAAESDGGFYIAGGAGDDVLTGGQVGDVFDLSFGGSDTATAGNGTNVFYLGAALDAGDKIAGGTGFDAVALSGDYTGGHAVIFGAATMTGIDEIDLDRGHSYHLTASDGTLATGGAMTVDAEFLGFADSAYFDGSAETDGSFTFFDGNGDDTFIGGGGDDFLSFEAGGHDTGKGGGGDDIVDACGTFQSAFDQFDGGTGYDVMELSAGETPNFGGYTGAKALHLNDTNFANFEELDLDGGGGYQITTTDAVTASGMQFLVDASGAFFGDVLIFDGSAESDGTFRFLLQDGTYRLTGGAGNDIFKVGSGFSSIDYIDGGGHGVSGDGNEIDFDGDYSFGMVFKPHNIENIQNLIFAGGHDYNFTTDDNNFASLDNIVIDATALGSGDKLTFDASAETDAVLNFFDGAGDDEIWGGQGTNTFNMVGGGTDTVHTAFSFTGQNLIAMGSTLTAADTIEGNVGFDTVDLDGDYSGANALVLSATTMTGIDKLTVNSGHDYDITTVDATVDSFLNPSMNVDSQSLLSTDTLTFDGSAETDCNFVFDVGAETDTLTGGELADTFNMRGHLTAADTIGGGGGIDTVNLDGDYSGANALVLGETTLQNIAYLHLAGSDAYDITTADGTVASGATMTVDATALLAGDSLIFDGTAESDGHFVITCGDGEDTIRSGGLADTITGGGGEDTFRYASGSASSSTWHDTITDYDADSDVFHLGNAVSAVYAASGAVSAASIDSDLAGLGAMHAGGATVITVTGGDLNGHTLLMVDGDGNATYDAGADYLFDITSYTGTIAAGDFI
ncbi:MAG TPA: hypothetical protein VG889_21400 [Rhizomicrobium sp.]|nr:hypothetical protein [Rhizomicrobium sp.]